MQLKFALYCFLARGVVFEKKKERKKTTNAATVKPMTTFLTNNKRQPLYGQTCEKFFDLAKAFDDVNQNYEIRTNK